MHVLLWVGDSETQNKTDIFMVYCRWAFADFVDS